MRTSTGTTNGGLGFSAVLQIVFIVLKLTKAINWSWWVVLIPTWIGVVVIAILVMVFIGMPLISISIENKKARKDKRNSKED